MFKYISHMHKAKANKVNHDGVSEAKSYDNKCQSFWATCHDILGDISHD